MLKKYLKYLTILIVVVVVAANSVYVKKLSDVKAASVSKKFNPESYANTFWKQKLVPSLGKAIAINHLTEMLKSDPEKTFSTYSHSLGIGNLKYFLVKGDGKVISVNENAVTVLVKTIASQNVITIATEFVYGNAVRDASGLISMNEFDNTMDFNNVSAGINRIIRTEVLPAFKSKIKEGDVIEFAGAIELNKKHLSLKEMEVTPIGLKIIN